LEYNLTVNKKEKLIRLQTNEADSFLAEIDNKKLHVTYKRIDDHTLRIEIDDDKMRKGVNAFLIDTDNGKIISINGITYTVCDKDDLSLGKTGKKISAGIPDKITPPMPATVISVMVNTEDNVQKGDGIVVISAMKMETTLTAPFNGRVISINTSEGEKVMPGDILVDIEKEK
jgi:biotin carboxyl carrier protein